MPKPVFDGIRFWVHDSVPMRDRWLEDIEKHGGILSQDMNTADVRIADHVKTRGRSPPENSVSYKFIKQSVKNGALEDVESHRITGAVRNPAVATRSSRGRRLPFTAADDQILSNWAASQERAGKALAGNVIFKELEAMCPHHTWQSWRSRYVNYKNLLPKSKIPTAESINHEGAPPVPAPRTRREARPTPAPSQPRQPNVGGSARVKFTAEDDQLLRDYVADMGKRTSGNKIYQELAEEHPHHSWHSWRDRYVRYVEPQLQAAAASKEHTPSVLRSQLLPGGKPVPPQTQTKSGEGRSAVPLPPDDPHLSSSTNGAVLDEGLPSVVAPVSKNTSLSQTQGQASLRRASHPNRAGSATSFRTAKTNTAVHTEDELEFRLAAIKLAKQIQPQAKAYLVRSALRELEHYLPQLQAASRGVLLRSKLRDFVEEDLERLQADANGALVRMALRHTGEIDDRGGSASGPVEQTRTAKDVTPRPPHEPRCRKEEFYEFLNEYLEATGARVNQWPKIQGRTLQLWELWDAVKSLDHGRSPSFRNWEQIAEYLGFDWIETPEVTSQLKNCYEVNLGGFEALHEEFEAEDLGSEAELEPQDPFAEWDTDGSVAQRGLTCEPLPFRSSPPRIIGQKRALEPDPELSSVDLGFSSVKRMRYSKDMVIPSSPEHRKATTAAPFAHGDPSHSSPEELTQAERHSRAILEPETQDFGFEEGSRFQQDFTSAKDTTPSQQLHVENDQLSPIPFSGFKLRGDLKVSRSGRLKSTFSRLRAVPDPAAAEHVNGHAPISRSDNSDKQHNGREPRQVPSTRSASPTEAKAKRRSLPASFRRAVSPPADGLKAAAPAPPGRACLPTTITNKRHTLALPSGAASRGRLPSHDTSANNTSTLPSHPSQTRSPTSTSAAPPKIIPDGPLPPEGSSSGEKLDFYLSLGYRCSHVVEAFKATLTWGLAAVVMEELKEGRGIPENWAGVWTVRDDGDLRYVLAVEREVQERRRSGRAPGREDRGRVRRAERLRGRLELKHGLQRVKDRVMSFKTLG